MRRAAWQRQHLEHRGQEACTPLFPATTSRRSSLHSAKDAGELCRAWGSLFRLLHHGIDVLFGGQFGATPHGGIAEFGIVALQRKSTDNVLPQEAVVQMVWVFASLHYKLVEARRT